MPRARRGEDIAPADLLLWHGAEVDRHARDGRYLLRWVVQPVQYADGDRLVMQFEPVTDPQHAGAERPGDDRAATADGERAIHPQPYARIGIRRGKGGGEPTEGGDQRVQSLPGPAGDLYRLDLSEAGGADVLERLDGGRCRVGQVRAGHRQQPVLEP